LALIRRDSCFEPLLMKILSVVVLVLVMNHY
jgi:hypothetical protein